MRNGCPRFRFKACRMSPRDPVQTTASDHFRSQISAEAGGILTIDLDAIVANWRELKRRAAPAECAAVVKADGYGCGLEPVAAALAKAGCNSFFVAHLGEG